MFEVPVIPGTADVIACFGYWPAFYDAEVLSIILNRSGDSSVAMHAFETTRDSDSTGHSVTEKHAVISFRMEGIPLDARWISNTLIEGFNSQTFSQVMPESLRGRKVMN